MNDDKSTKTGNILAAAFIVSLILIPFIVPACVGCINSHDSSDSLSSHTYTDTDDEYTTYTPSNSSKSSHSSKSSYSTSSKKSTAKTQKTCVACNGIGRVKQYATNDPWDEGYWIECQVCHGKGWYYE